MLGDHFVLLIYCMFAQAKVPRGDNLSGQIGILRIHFLSTDGKFQLS